MNKNKNAILSVDAALGPCSVAVSRAGKVLAFRLEETARHQARQLVPMIEACLTEAGLGYTDLALILSSVGPGTFTGLRIGLAAAHGIGFAAEIPVRGVTTLAMAAQAAGGEGLVRVALNAGKGEVYHQLFNLAGGAPSPLDEARLSAPSDLPASPRLAGNAPAKWFPDISFESIQPDARNVDALAQASALHLPPEPLYIRPPDAKEPG